MAKKAVTDRGVCIRAACDAFRISESCYRYELEFDAENDEVANWLIKLTYGGQVRGELPCGAYRGVG
jgi:putative transposase